MAIWTDFMGVLRAPRMRRTPRPVPGPTDRPNFPYGPRLGLGLAERLGSTLGLAAYSFTPYGPAVVAVREAERGLSRFARTLLPEAEIADPMGVYEFKFHLTDLGRPDIFLKRLGNHQKDKFIIGMGRGMIAGRDRREWRDIKSILAREGTDIYAVLKDSSPLQAHMMIYEKSLTGTCGRKDMVEMVDEWMVGTYAGKDHLRRNTKKDATTGEYQRRGFGRSLHRRAWEQLEDEHLLVFDPATPFGSTQKSATPLQRKSFIQHISDTAQDLRSQAASAPTTAAAASLLRQADALDRSVNLIESKLAREKFIGGSYRGFKGFKSLYSGRAFSELLFRGFITGGMWRDWKDKGMFAWQRRLGARMERYSLNLGRRVAPIGQGIRRRVYYGPKKWASKVGNKVKGTSTYKALATLYNNLPAPVKALLKGPLKIIKAAGWVAKKAVLLASNPIIFILSLVGDAYDWVKDKIKRALKRKIFRQIKNFVRTRVVPAIRRVASQILQSIIKPILNALRNLLMRLVQAVVRVLVQLIVQLATALWAALAGALGTTGAIILLIALVIVIALIVLIHIGSSFAPEYAGLNVPEDPSLVQVIKTVDPSEIADNLTGGKTAEVTYTVVVSNKGDQDLRITKIEDTKYQVQVDNNCSDLIDKVVAPLAQTDSADCTYKMVLQNVSDSYVDNTIKVTANMGGIVVSGVSSASVKVGNPPVKKPCGWPASGTITQLFGVPGYAGGTHWGLDIGAGSLPGHDQPNYSMLDGTIYRAHWWSDNCFGNIVIKSDDNSYSVRYLHMDEAAVNAWKDKIGTRVSLGEYIGKTKKGYPRNSCTSGAHLHYEVREGISDDTTIRRDPQDYSGDAWKAVGEAVSAGGCFTP